MTMSPSSDMRERARSLEQAFCGVVGDPLTAEYLASAPGRVNLIGEHTDYNDGFVFPIAIDRGIDAAVGRRPDRQVRVVACDFGESTEFALDAIAPEPERRWANYVRGVALELAQAGVPLIGADLAVGGDLPVGAGVSSSAALELAAARALLAVCGASIPGPELSRLCRRAENKFVGVGCGIMDQYISGMGQRDTAMLLDCRSLAFELVPIPPGAAFVVCDTRKARELGDSAYNERRAQCEAGAAALGVPSLRDASLADLEEARERMEPLVWRRCRHVVTETGRTLRAAECLRQGQLAAFGRLMDESHVSLREDYEVSCAELDAMVAAAHQAAGCLGARLTGAGFGGCAVALVEAGAEASFVERTAAAYRESTGIQPEIYTVKASAGARVTELAT